MGFEEKVDVIDLIINVLRDHEKSLDDLVSRLEKTLEKSAPSAAPALARVEQARPMVSATLRRWQEFREKCIGAGIAAFDIEEKRFKASAVKDGVLYMYQEEMPDMEIRFKEKDDRAVIDGIEIGGAALVPTVLRGRLECGLDVSVKGSEIRLPDGVVVYKVVYDIDTEDARSWMAFQLKVDKKSVIQGKLQI